MDLTDKLIKNEQKQIDTNQYLEKLDKEFEILEPEELKYSAEKETLFKERQEISHTDLLKALKRKDEVTAGNSFDMTGGDGYYLAVKRYKAQKEVVDATISQTNKAIEYFTKGSGGNEFNAVKYAITQLWIAREKNANDGSEIPDELYDNVKSAADAYIKTHNSVRLTMSGAKRFKMAEILSENIMNLPYLLEHTKDLDKEIEFAKEDSYYSYAKDNAILGSATVLEDKRKLPFEDIDPLVDAFQTYSADTDVLTLTGSEKLGYKKSYSAYQIMNCIKRGVFTKEELIDLVEKRVPLKGKSEKVKRFNRQKDVVYEILEKMKLMDDMYESDPGLQASAKLYRGIGNRQILDLLGLKNEKALKNKTKNLEYIRERLEGLVGKTFLDNAYISASRNADVADEFAYFQADKSAITVVFDVIARKGTKAVGVEKISMLPEEQELLLKPGTKMFIRGFSVSTRKIAGMKRPLIRIQAEAR